jgi:hypothetical protein
MAAAPQFKIYKADGEYVAACKYAEDAAALVAVLGTGTTIRLGHRFVVWTEGAEAIPAGESYDTVAATIAEREREQLGKFWYGQQDAGAK